MSDGYVEERKCAGILKALALIIANDAGLLTLDETDRAFIAAALNHVLT